MAHLSFATHSPQHPALTRLNHDRAVAAARKLAKAFSNRRKIALTVLVVVMMALWAGNLVLGILFRSAADPQRIAAWIPLSLVMYTLFHIVKITFRTPDDPFAWTAAERQILLTAPVTRFQLIAYRLRSYGMAVLAKALCITLVLIPDLNFLPAGFVGIALGLAIVELSRLAMEIVANSLSAKQRMTARCVVLLSIAGFVSMVTFSVNGPISVSASSMGNVPVELVKLYYGAVLELIATPIGQFLTTPWQWAGCVALADSVNTRTVIALAGLMTMTAVLATGVYELDRLVQRRQRRLDRQLWRSRSLAAESNVAAQASAASRRRVPFRFRGAGSIAWYQFRGAVHYRATVTFALALPIALCCFPLLGESDSFSTLITMMAGVAFYSFLLLPHGLMLDFRRDVDQLAVWKSMPISPLAVAAGQLCIPVALMSIFQGIVLLIAASVSPVSLGDAITGWVILIPVSVLIMALENIVFLLHPIRRNQEGIEVFIRTSLTFTAKSLLYGVGLAAVLCWAFGAMNLSEAFANPTLMRPPLFVGGLIAFTSMAAAGSLWVLSRLFARLDPSTDLPDVA